MDAGINRRVDAAEMSARTYWPGCTKCRETQEAARSVLAEAGEEAEVEKMEDIAPMTADGVLTTPAVELDSKVGVAGRVPNPGKIRWQIVT